MIAADQRAADFNTLRRVRRSLLMAFSRFATSYFCLLEKTYACPDGTASQAAGGSVPTAMQRKQNAPAHPSGPTNCADVYKQPVWLEVALPWLLARFKR
jgi:hypothetical protein